jgi:23S rRNA (uracil1939-C5)-methyltransferase
VPSDTLDLDVLRVAHGGFAVAQAVGGVGPWVLLRGAIPGERVRATVETRKGVRFGQVTAVLAASADRVDAPDHPGLDYGHVSLARQHALKRGVLLDAMERAQVAAPETLDALVPSPLAWGYRNTIQPAVVARTASGTQLGYRAADSHALIPLARDPVANPALQKAWEILCAHPTPAGVVELVLRGNDAGDALLAWISKAPTRTLQAAAHDLVRAGVHGVMAAPWDPRGRFRGGAERLAGARNLTQTFGDVTLTLTATAFSQPNPAAAGVLFQTVRAWAPPAQHALDLYGGQGVIGMHLAGQSERVSVIDIDKGSIERGRADAARLGLGNITHTRLDAREVRVPNDVDLVVVDPPRAGLAASTRDAIHESRASTLMYVSCDVATWARDVADFQKRGWRLERVQPFDFQPHTHHLEILSRLRR